MTRMHTTKYTTRRVTTFCAFALSALLSSTALAEVPLTGTQVQVDEDFAWVLLLSPGELPEPSLRIGHGEVKLWFRGTDHERLTQQGDGLAFRDVRVRGGAGDSALVHIRLGDRREISTEDIAVVPFDGGSAVRFRRSALPQRPAEMSGVQAIDANEEHSEPSVELGAGFGEDSRAEIDLAAEPEADADPESDADATEDSPLFATDTEGVVAGGALSGAGDSSGSPVGLLLIITALLGALLVVVRLVAKRRKGLAPVPDIDVISTKRIGPRHQLIVVRALGEEHLLSVNGAQTQLITSVSQDSELPESMLRLTGPATPSTAPAADPVDSRPPVTFSMPPRSKPSSDERFGARLLDLASRRTDTAPAPAPSSATSAVAGLLELRRRLS